MRELYKLLGIKLAMLMAYHPQTDGQTEHINQVLEGYLHIFTSRQQDNWDDLLPSGKFHYNNSQHSSTQQTFMLDTGRNPRMGFEPSSLALPWSQLKNTWHWELRKQRQHLQRQKMSTPCTTTANMSLPWYLHLWTESG
jgi:hypothetical protein